MKRSLFTTFWIGAVAAGLAIALQMSGLLSHPGALLGKILGLPPNGAVGFWNFVVVIALGFAVAWAMLQVTKAAHRTALAVVLIVELIGAAWIFAAAGVSFPPQPAILATALATAFALGVTATHSDRQRQATAGLFAGRLAQSGVDRLTENETLKLAEPSAREASVVFCEIANEAELIDDLPPAACAQLTRQFIECANRRFLPEGGYLHAADGEGIRVLFGFPNPSEQHAADAARAALAFREDFRAAAALRPDLLGRIDLRIGISSGVVVAALQDGVFEGPIVVAGEPLEVARRLARANRVYGSQVLLGPRTFSAAGKTIVARPIDFLRSAEPHERIEVYELLALADQATLGEIARRDHFWTAIVYFRERRWNEAFAEFNRARGEHGEQDLPLQWYLRRLEPLCLHRTAEPAAVVEPLVPH